MTTTNHVLDRSLTLAVTSNDIDACRALAQACGGELYSDPREAWQHLPFRALATVVTDRLDAAREAADVGLYLACARVIKHGPQTSVGVFPLVRNPALTHEQADTHWREVHAPLALTHHRYMSRYLQLSVLTTLAGPELDGIALCGFDLETDLRQRFFSEPDSREVIGADVARFADTERSPRRLVAIPESFAV